MEAKICQRKQGTELSYGADMWTQHISLPLLICEEELSLKPHRCSAARPPLRGPWLCEPASRRGCLYRSVAALTAASLVYMLCVLLQDFVNTLTTIVSHPAKTDGFELLGIRSAILESFDPRTLLLSPSLFAGWLHYR